MALVDHLSALSTRYSALQNRGQRVAAATTAPSSSSTTDEPTALVAAASLALRRTLHEEAGRQEATACKHSLQTARSVEANERHAASTATLRALEARVDQLLGMSAGSANHHHQDLYDDSIHLIKQSLQSERHAYTLEMEKKERAFERDYSALRRTLLAERAARQASERQLHDQLERARELFSAELAQLRSARLASEERFLGLAGSSGGDRNHRRPRSRSDRLPTSGGAEPLTTPWSVGRSSRPGGGWGSGDL